MEPGWRWASEARGERAAGARGAEHAPRAVAARAAVALTMLAALLAAACGGVAKPADRAAMARGEHVADSLRQAARAASLPGAATARAADAVVASEAAVSLGYLERQRLGLGSPFRLIDYALRDPRLRPELRRDVAWALLARAARGEGFLVDPAAFGDSGMVPGTGDARRSEFHHALVDETVTKAPDARTGETAVRLAYALARQEGLVNDRAVQASTRAAAQARDRRLAREDAQRLLRSARRQGDVLAVVPQWRAERRFLVETPLLHDRLRANEREATHTALRLVARIRTSLDAVDRTVAAEQASRLAAADLAAARDSARADSLRADSVRAAAAHADSVRAERRRGRARATPERVAEAATAPMDTTATRGLTVASASAATTTMMEAVPLVADTATWLPPAAARRLAMLGERLPPQAPVAVMTSAYRRQLLVALRAREAERRPGGEDEDAARERVRWETRWHFAQRARGEESLAAEYALAVDALGDHGAAAARARAELAGVTLAAAVALRPYAQETPWFPGSAAPTAAQLAARFGLRRVAFDSAIPVGWRPYYLRQLGEAVSDLQRVLPTLRLDGLAVQVGESVKRDSALALHDPATRTVYLPAATSAGTVAHELAHDLDWQTARAQLAMRGAYSTDRLARTGTGRLGSSIRGLTAARPRSGSTGSDRPAEVFARGVDWYVAAALAREGRLSGALTSVQDEALPGYAGVSPPDAAGDAASALTDVLDDMTLLSTAGRGWFLARFGRGRVPDAAALVQAVIDASPTWGAERALRTMGASTVMNGRASEEPRADARPKCDVDDADRSWRAELLWAAADAKARGMLRARAQGTPQPVRRSWEARAVAGGPWGPELGEVAVARIRSALLREAARRDAERGPIAGLGVAALALSCW